MWSRSTSFIGLSVGVLVMALSVEASAQGAPPPPPPGAEPAPAPAPAPAPPPEGAAPPPAAPAPAGPPPGAAPPPAQGGYAAQVGAAPPPVDEEGVHTHDGFYLRLGLGFGSASGTAKRKFASIEDEQDGSGGGFASEFALGGTVAPGLALGGGIYGISVPSPTYEPEVGDDVDGDTLVLSSIGPFVDYYFDPNGGGHIQASVGLGVANQGKGDLDAAYTGTGVALMFGGGYEWWVGEQWSIGVLARVQYFSVSGHPDEDDANDLGFDAEDVDVEASFLVPALLLSITYH